MATVQDKNIDSAMEKGSPETPGALDEHTPATHVNATKFHLPRLPSKNVLWFIVKYVICVLTLTTLVVLAFQVYEDHYDYNSLLAKYNDLVNHATDVDPKMARAIQATDGGQVFTSTIAPFITATDEVDVSALPCTGLETSVSTSVTAAPIATSITPVGYSLGSSLSPETTTATATTLDVTTITIPRSTLTLTTTLTTSPGEFTSSADALSASILSSSSLSSGEVTTTTTIFQPATVTATLSALSSLPAELSSYPLVSSESASETGICAPGTTLTITATVLVSPLSSSQPLTTTTVSVINTLTTITKIVSGQQTILVTQTLSPSIATGLSSVDALSGSISSTVAPVLGTSVFGTAGATTITLTSTASNNYTVSHTGGPGPGATISISDGAKGPKPLGASHGKPSGSVYCVVMIITALVTLFI